MNYGSKVSQICLTQSLARGFTTTALGKCVPRVQTGPICASQSFRDQMSEAKKIEGFTHSHCYLTLTDYTSKSAEPHVPASQAGLNPPCNLLGLLLEPDELQSLGCEEKLKSAWIPHPVGSKM